MLRECQGVKILVCEHSFSRKAVIKGGFEIRCSKCTLTQKELIDMSHFVQTGEIKTLQIE